MGDALASVEDDGIQGVSQDRAQCLGNLFLRIQDQRLYGLSGLSSFKSCLIASRERLGFSYSSVKRLAAAARVVERLQGHSLLPTCERQVSLIATFDSPNIRMTGQL